MIAPYDLTCVLHARPELRTRDAIVSALQTHAVVLLRFASGDPLKAFACTLFPQLHAKIPAGEWEAIGISMCSVGPSMCDQSLRAFVAHDHGLCVAVEGVSTTASVKCDACSV